MSGLNVLPRRIKTSFHLMRFMSLFFSMITSITSLKGLSPRLVTRSFSSSPSFAPRHHHLHHPRLSPLLSPPPPNKHRRLPGLLQSSVSPIPGSSSSPSPNPAPPPPVTPVPVPQEFLDALDLAYKKFRGFEPPNSKRHSSIELAFAAIKSSTTTSLSSPFAPLSLPPSSTTTKIQAAKLISNHSNTVREEFMARHQIDDLTMKYVHRLFDSLSRLLANEANSSSGARSKVLDAAAFCYHYQVKGERANRVNF